MKLTIDQLKRNSLFFIVATITACATMNPGRKAPNNASSASAEYMVPPVVQKPHTDTVPGKQRRLTQKEIQQYLRSQYKLNYDEFISPDLRRLTEIIVSQDRRLDLQAQSFTYMATYMQETRRRTDSIARERNHYRSVSLNNDTAYQNKVIALQKQLLDQSHQWQVANKKQIDFNTIVAVSCLIGVAVLGIILFMLWYRVNRLYKKIVNYA